MFKQQKNEKFSIRKFKTGAASAKIASVVAISVLTLGATPLVSANTQEPVSSTEKEVKPVQEVTKAQVESAKSHVETATEKVNTATTANNTANEAVQQPSQ